MELSASLTENLRALRDALEHNGSVIYREFQNRRDASCRGCAVFIDGMVNAQTINLSILTPLQNAVLPEGEAAALPGLLRSVVSGNEAVEADTLEAVLDAVLYGDTAVLLDGQPAALIVNSKGFSIRAVGEPDDEKTLRGPREGFTENMLTNMSLIRRKLQSPALKFVYRKFGEQTRTRACVCYLEGVADPKLVAEFNRRLDRVCADGVFDVQYLTERVRDHRYSLFKTVGETEKPDVAAARLLEGRVALVLDGTPLVMTVPCLFMELLQSPDDYYLSFYYASAGRILRLLALFLTVSMPALYVALMAYHPEMIPTRLLLSILSAVDGVPFPTVVETAAMLVLFEVLSEAGLRMPSKMGQALSIVGALVVGQAAVDAKIVSAYTVIVVALTGITGLMVPRFRGACLILRFATLFCAATLGLNGYVLSMVALTAYLCGVRSFGLPYTQSLFQFRRRPGKDVVLRAPHFTR